jgi:dTDP-4-amino-4,6-dideoxygalactose transaminase
MELLFAPYCFGFVRGHRYLQEAQVLRLAQVLQSRNEDGGSTAEFERRFAACVGPGQAKSAASGRMAFYMLLRALDIGPGDEVVLPALTCAVMPNAVWRAGAKPVFADIDPGTFGSEADSISKVLVGRSKLIVAQHSFGIPCEIGPIVELGRRRGIPVVEDCAIAFDSAIDGKKVGEWGDAAIFSTDHTKPINTMIGGVFYTNQPALFEKFRAQTEVAAPLSAGHQQRIWRRFNFERSWCNPSHYPRTILRLYLDHALQLAMRVVTNKPSQTAFLQQDFGRQPGPAAYYPYPARLPPFLAQLGIFELERWPQERRSRESLLKNYLALAEEAGLRPELPSAYFDGRRQIVPLRLAFAVPDKNATFRRMRSINVDETWFPTPLIGSAGGPETLGYTWGSSPRAESCAQDMVNWPCVVPAEWHQRLLDDFRKVFRPNN